MFLSTELTQIIDYPAYLKTTYLKSDVTKNQSNNLRVFFLHFLHNLSAELEVPNSWNPYASLILKKS